MYVCTYIYIYIYMCVCVCMYASLVAQTERNLPAMQETQV